MKLVKSIFRGLRSRYMQWKKLSIDRQLDEIYLLYLIISWLKLLKFDRYNKRDLS